jgi:hypothetical protein
MSRYLSESGDRVFFETEEALVPQDTNGLMDVYEWERGGSGSCPSGRGGCLFLISTGQSSEPSYFSEASASGDNVFFFTRQALVSQDYDELVDVYDARVDGGIQSQNPSPPQAPCANEQTCRQAPNGVPALGVPASQVFSGPGDPAAPIEATAPPRVQPKTLTPPQKLAVALRACAKEPRRKRAGCEVRARKRLGPTSRASKSDRRGR